MTILADSCDWDSCGWGHCPTDEDADAEGWCPLPAGHDGEHEFEEDAQ